VEHNQLIYVAGSETLIGAALLRRLRRDGYRRILDDGPHGLGLADPRQVEDFFAAHRPAYVLHAAGTSGGIRANQLRPAELCQENLAATLNLLQAAHRHGVRRLLYLASSCCYPRNAPQPSSPEHLWTGPLEPTSEAYAAAKLAGIALCRAHRQQHGDDYLVGIPANPYGPGDDVDACQAHVISSLITRMHTAKLEGASRLSIWGTGRAIREFIFADDLADACLCVMTQPRLPDIINLGSGQAVTIAELAQLVANVVGYRGELTFDASQPDGSPRKELDSSALRELGWQPTTPLEQGIAATYAWYLRTLARSASEGELPSVPASPALALRASVPASGRALHAG
jgi:GDP-L-fucose synthase